MSLQIIPKSMQFLAAFMPMWSAFLVGVARAAPGALAALKPECIGERRLISRLLAAARNAAMRWESNHMLHSTNLPPAVLAYCIPLKLHAPAGYFALILKHVMRLRMLEN
jgi:hypothetical protein